MTNRERDRRDQRRLAYLMAALAFLVFAFGEAATKAMTEHNAARLEQAYD